MELDFRKLFAPLQRAENDTEIDAIFSDASEWLGRERSALRRHIHAQANPPKPLDVDWAFHLYALLRCFDTLIEVSPMRAYPALISHLGLLRFRPPVFHPFFCEIVHVTQLPDDDAAPVIDRIFWPACFMGTQLLNRAGVSVAAGRKHVVKERAEQNTMFWAWARQNRKCNDLSHGWGSNSQWGTSIRQDHLSCGTLYYNLRENAPSGPEDTPAELRDELLRFRCLVRSEEGPKDEHFPYSLTRTEPLPAGYPAPKGLV